jgi:hypothetical protein
MAFMQSMFEAYVKSQKKAGKSKKRKAERANFWRKIPADQEALLKNQEKARYRRN